MKKLRSIIPENWLTPSKALNLTDKDFKGIKPAIKHKKTKQVIVGKPGDLHAELAAKTSTPAGKYWYRGFWHKKHGYSDEPHGHLDALELTNKKVSMKRITKAKIWNSEREAR